MKTRWYIVIKSQDAWWVDCEGRSFGPVPTKEEASRYARQVAEIFGEKTLRRDVWVPDDAGKLKLVWSVGPEK